ncbi:DUF421 domain-containing protein [Aureibacillus halotolerans]|uniref:Uncharacterized membrane protein YcaP (DUF421 family) n=1 Tax=Aureibacillus halotolerans TaxID=1508390 RepID=A0A4R6TXG4_9BACI|nr:DUF421 domain-containing protein [Aureibacillus halotolerans]TDQ37986.1 uncharacterized membrane protein YcaP (DUF421 family) [Aureibacillus halotolerans]
MDMVIIVLRTVLFYGIILLIFRLMGKREIGELSILDLVVFIMIAEMAVSAIEEPKDPIFDTIVPMAVLLLIQLGLAYFQLKNQKLREVIDGKPSFIIRNGEINEKEMKKQRYNFTDLLIQLREEKIHDVRDVDVAILEPSGKLSVFEKNPASSQRPFYSLPFILDGQIQSRHLHENGKDEEWLKDVLKQHDIVDYTSLLYLSVAADGTLFMQKKN